jgi:hypothetical protein
MITSYVGWKIRYNKKDYICIKETTEDDDTKCWMKDGIFIWKSSIDSGRSRYDRTPVRAIQPIQEMDV